MVQKAQSPPAVSSHVPDVHRHRDDQRVRFMVFHGPTYGAHCFVNDRFDSSMMNGLQAVPTWDACEWRYLVLQTRLLRRASVFGHPRSTILGLLSALYSLGSICSLPFVPLVTDKWGRRFAIAFGSVIMIIGAALQTASQDCTCQSRLHACTG